MQQADVFVFSGIVDQDGDRDGLPNVILEAAATGVPIVASRVGGVAEFITDDEEGRLVNPGDPLAIASAIVELAEDWNLGERFAKAARTKVEEEYSQKRNCAALAKLFRDHADLEGL